MQRRPISVSPRPPSTIFPLYRRHIRQAKGERERGYGARSHPALATIDTVRRSTAPTLITPNQTSQPPCIHCACTATTTLSKSLWNAIKPKTGFWSAARTPDRRLYCGVQQKMATAMADAPGEQKNGEGTVPFLDIVNTLEQTGKTGACANGYKDPVLPLRPRVCGCGRGTELPAGPRFGHRLPSLPAVVPTPLCCIWDRDDLVPQLVFNV